MGGVVEDDAASLGALFQMFPPLCRLGWLIVICSLSLVDCALDSRSTLDPMSYQHETIRCARHSPIVDLFCFHYMRMYIYVRNFAPFL